jgi:transcriptional regulator GlxA family with amidase domain
VPNPDSCTAAKQISIRSARLRAGGVSLCIDTTLHILARVAGEDVANEAARILEYTRARRANSVDFPPVVVRGA